MRFAIQKLWLENSQNTQQSTVELTIFVDTPMGEGEYGGIGTAVEFVVWGEDKQCLAGGGGKISWCAVCRDVCLLKFCRFSTPVIPECLRRASEQR